MKTLLIDTETTGFKDPQVIEFAWIPINDDLTEGHNIALAVRYKPNIKIEYGAMATHHITEEDLIGCPPQTNCKLPEDVSYIIGHNIDFDWEALGKPNVKRICTLALARFSWPELDSHSLGALMYFLKGAGAKALVKNAHSAPEDCWMTLLVLRALAEKLNLKTVEEAYAKSEIARIPTKMTFGKYKDAPISAVPRDYAQWYKRQADTDPYVIEAFRRAGLLF